MPDQDGLRFLFDIQDKITAKLAKIEAKSKASAAKIDKAFTRASKSQQTQADKAIRAEQRRIAAVNKAHARALEAIKRESDAFKRSMTRMASAATVAFAAVAGKSLEMASGYDAAMRSVQAKTGATGEVLEKLSAQAREMGRTMVHSATQAARGQAFLAQAGFDANEILEALPGTLALATAGELDLASAADIASNVLSGFRLETEHTGRVTDVLAAIAARTNTSVSQMGVALAKAAPSAAAAGWSLEETAAAIGRLSDAGIQAEEAGTVLKTMLARLAAPTGKLEKLMTATGISVQDTSGKMLPLNDIIAQLAPHADNTGLMFELLGTRGANAGLILGSLGDKNLRDLTKELENSEGAAQKMADIMGGGLWGSLKKIQSIVESAYISFGERLAPALQKGADLFAKLPAPIQEVVVITGSLVGAMGGLMLIMPQSFGALVQFPGKLLKLGKALKATTIAQRALNMAMRLNPIGLVITAVAALAAGIYVLWKRYNNLQETFDVTAASTEDLTARHDELTKKIAAATEKLERQHKVYSRGVPKAARALRALVAEREELERHIQKREELAKAEKKATQVRVKAVGDYSDALIEAEEAVHDLDKTEREMNVTRKWTLVIERRMHETFINRVAALRKGFKDNQEALDAEAESIEALRRALLGLPTDDVVEDFERLKTVWGELDEEERIRATDEYAEALRIAAENGIELSDAQVEIAESGAEMGTAWVDGFFGTMKRAFEGGGGFTGGIKSLASQAFGQIFSKIGGESGGGFTDALEKIFSGDGFLGKIGAAGTKIGGKLGEFLSLGLNGIPIVGPFLAGFGPLLAQGLKKVPWGKVWTVWKDVWTLGLHRFIGGPSGMEKSGRKVAHEFRQGIIDGLTPEQFAEVGESWKQGWDSSVIIAVRDAAIAGGMTFEAATALGLTMYNALWAAEKEGPEAVQRVIDQITQIINEGNAAGEAALLAAEDRARRIQEHQDRIDEIEKQRAATRLEFKLKAIEEEREAELEALRDKHKVELEAIDQQSADRLSALKDRHAAELSEIEKARRDALSPVEQAIQDELDDAEIAVQLRIDLRKAGWDAEKIDAAKARAAESTARLEERRELEAGMDEAEAAIRARHQPEIDRINAHWDAKQKVATDRHKIEVAEEVANSKLLRETMEDRHEAELGAVNAHYDALIDAAKGIIRRSLEEWEQYYDDLIALERAKIAKIEAEAPDASVAPPTTTPTTPTTQNAWHEHSSDPYWHYFAPMHDPTHSYTDPSHKHIPRQHGGPVSAGGSYMVGEVGPERFIPSERGRIDPHGSRGDGGVDIKDLARAVAEAMDGVKMDVDGRDFGRLVVRHQPRAAAELGGRR